MPKHTLDTVPVECDALRSDIAQALEQAAERAQELEIIGLALFDSVVETTRTDPADELRDRAIRLRSGARYATDVASEIERTAGRLEGLASARSIIEGEMDARESAPKPGKRK